MEPLTDEATLHLLIATVAMHALLQSGIYGSDPRLVAKESFIMAAEMKGELNRIYVEEGSEPRK